MYVELEPDPNFYAERDHTSYFGSYGEALLTNVQVTCIVTSY